MSEILNVVGNGYIKNGKVEGTFHWKIPNFSQLCPEIATERSTLTHIWSPVFSVDQKDGQNLKWKSFVPYGKDNIGYSLIRVTDKKNGNVVADDKSKFVNCSYKLGFGNKNNPFVVSEFVEKYPFNIMKQYNYWGCYKLMTISDFYKRREELLQEDTFRVTIQMVIYPNDTPADLSPVFKDLSREKFPDCEIKCGESSFPCHKLILSSHSRVFDRMFKSGLEESVKGQVVIQDMEPAAVETLLKFMYTGQVNLPENCSWTDLLYGAEKYELMDLKNLCFNKMLDDLTMDNFGTLFVAAQNYNGTKGVRWCVNAYYEDNMKELMRKANFRDIFFKNPRIFYPDYKD